MVKEAKSNVNNLNLYFIYYISSEYFGAVDDDDL